MNQILAMGNKNGKNNNNSGTLVDIKKIVLFFSIAIIIFGIFLIVNGVVGIYKNKNSNLGNNQGGTTTPVLETPSTSNNIVDNQKPEIDILVSGEKVRIVAKDETEIAYIEYKWNDEESEIIEAESDQIELETTVTIKQGTNTLNVVAVDRSGNEQEKTQTFQGRTKPEIKLYINDTQKDRVVIEAKCVDGISKLEFAVNGGQIQRIPLSEYSSLTKEDWATIGVIAEYSDDGKIINVQYTQKLIEGENKFEVYAYSVEGLVGESSATTIYTAQ